MIVLDAVDLTKVYVGGDGGTITVLDGVHLQVNRGQMVAVVGASGTGKSTLLHLLGALDKPTRGTVHIAGHSVTGRGDDELSELRNGSIGFVFQFHHLLREFTARENVMMPMRIAGWDVAKAERRADDLLARVGLAGRAHHRPAALSGGEQQRTAVARALAIDPAVLLADEPSGNLDHMNSERLHDLFAELSRDLEIAMVIATHNRSLAARADRTLLLEDGRLTDTDVREVRPLMVCDSCRERDAVVHLTTIEDNAVHQLHLCERCAADRGVETTVNQPKHPLGEFLQAVHQQTASATDGLRCTFCNTTMTDFRATGRWGCARCYTNFEAGIRELLRRVHGNHRHVGRSYRAPMSETLERAAVLGELKDRLRRAIDSEQFELAADLRDRIRVME